MGLAVGLISHVGMSSPADRCREVHTGGQVAREGHSPPQGP